MITENMKINDPGRFMHMNNKIIKLQPCFKCFISEI